MEFLETIAKLKLDEDEVSVHLITMEDDFKGPQQLEQFQKMQDTLLLTLAGRSCWIVDWTFFSTMK